MAVYDAAYRRFFSGENEKMRIIFDGNTAPWWVWVLKYLPVILLVVWGIAVMIKISIQEYRQNKRHNRHK